MKDPLVSIVIPVYNEVNYLEECILSIQSQTYHNFECLFIDDGSTDNTAKIIKSFIENDIRIKLIQKKHSGLIQTINKGLRNAKGDIICRLDGDDIIPKNRLELQVGKLQKCGNKSLVTGKVNYFPEENISFAYKEYENWLNSLKEPNDFIENCFIECPVAAPSWMMFRTDVEQLGYFDENIYPEDYNFMLKAIVNGISFYSINEYVLHWRDYPTRTSKMLDDYSRENFRKVRALYLPKFLEKFTSYKKIVIFGLGSNGKALCKILQKHNLKPEAFVDSHPKRIGKSILDLPVYDINNSEFYKDFYILIALRDKTVKEKISLYLAQLNKHPVKDYIFCC